MSIFNQLSRRIRQLFTRGLVNMVDTQTLVQTMQVELLGDEVLDGVEHVENYGFTSCPKAGAEVVAASIGGSRANTIIISAFDRRFRVKNLAPGEVAIYTDEGDKIHFQRGGNIAITAGASIAVTAPDITIAASTKVVLDSPNVEVTGALSVTGELSATTVVASGAVTIEGVEFSLHVHSGVTVGSGNTGGLPS